MGTAAMESNYNQCQQYPSYQESVGDSMQRTLYVGNLSRRVTEELLYGIFSELGSPPTTCKMMNEHCTNDPYCFVEFQDHKIANAAKLYMNGRKVFEKVRAFLFTMFQKK